MKLNVLTGIFTVFIVIVILIRISIYMEDDEDYQDDQIIIEDKTPELSDSESESSIL